MTTFGTYLRQLREEQNLTTVELARMLNNRGCRVTQSMIRRFEDGITLPDQSVLNEISAAFNVSGDVLGLYAGRVPAALPLPQDTQDTETWFMLFRKVFEK